MVVLQDLGRCQPSVLAGVWPAASATVQTRQIAKQQARQLLSKKASAAWSATEAREVEDEVEVKVSTPKIGPSKAQSEKWTGCTPEELGVQLLTSTDAHHNADKCVLMPDAMRPYTCSELNSPARQL